MELRVFGPVQAVRDGRPVAIGGPKPRLLLALLVAHRGRTVTTDRLCEELWGDAQPAGPPAVLQSHVSRLRRALRPGAEIVSRPPGYALEVDEERVDAGRFEHLVGIGRSAGDPATAAARLEAALELWRGPAFEEFAQLEWARGEAVRLEEIRLVALEELFEARLTLGEHAMVIGELEALVESHPLRERYWLQLMVALYRSGRHGDALRRAETLRTLLRDGLGLDPSLALRELEQKILAEDPTLDIGRAPLGSRSRRAPAHGALVGREHDVEVVTGLVEGERLVTLAGPGGVGKTRLAWQIAAELWDRMPHGVFVVELGAVREPASTVAAIATALEVQQRQHLSVDETVVEYLRDRRALLVLDNCEHLLEAVGPLVQRLRTWCPELTVLTTSREPLGVAGEHVWPVGPLGLAPADADAATVAAAPAVRLFAERAAASRPGFELTSENAAAVNAIVRGLDGLPLAIELAAARLRAMSPAALADRLDHRFQLLGSPHGSADPRHRTLYDLVAWSYELLEPSERTLFARLCLFADGFDLEAAEMVCAFDDVDAGAISSLVVHLVDKSMVQLVDPDAPRYRLLETLPRVRARPARRGGARDGPRPSRPLVPRARGAMRDRARRTGRGGSHPSPRPRARQPAGRVLDRRRPPRRRSRVASRDRDARARVPDDAVRDHAVGPRCDRDPGRGRAPAVAARARGGGVRPLRPRRPRDRDRDGRRGDRGGATPGSRRVRPGRAHPGQRLVLPRRGQDGSRLDEPDARLRSKRRLARATRARAVHGVGRADEHRRRRPGARSSRAKRVPPPTRAGHRPPTRRLPTPWASRSSRPTPTRQRPIWRTRPRPRRAPGTAGWRPSR